MEMRDLKSGFIKYSKRWLWNFLRLLTITFNGLILFGEGRESTSSRSYRKGVVGDNKFFAVLRTIIDFFLGEDHCMKAFINEGKLTSTWGRGSSRD